MNEKYLNFLKLTHGNVNKPTNPCERLYIDNKHYMMVSNSNFNLYLLGKKLKKKEKFIL